MGAMWGVHNDILGRELVEKGFISIGWDKVPDLRTVGNDRNRMKATVERAYPEAKPGAIPTPTRPSRRPLRRPNPNQR